MYLKLMTGTAGSFRIIDAVDIAFLRENGSAYAEVRNADGTLRDTFQIRGTAFILNGDGNTIDTFAEVAAERQSK